MSSPQNILKFTLLVASILLLEQHYVVLGRELEWHTPVMPKSSFSKPRPAPANAGFSFNRHKQEETDAFRPTAPGHSPGMGHEAPPKRL
uniref:Uncharacterized protein n=1 Tax=Nelumbo nucifera TaxID=4432 RepID=A0A822XYB3_NELNU|nr:TPA_asm: hypothetical protein HUJ06_026466 [Nelumbo nucifera]